MFEKFTGSAKRVMLLANQEAGRYNHEHIIPEHIFIGLLREGSGIGAMVFRDLKVDLGSVEEMVRLEVEKQERPKPDNLQIISQPSPNPVAKQVIEGAIAEALALNRGYVTTEHLLLGLMLAKDCVPARVLGSLGVVIEKVRELVTNYYAEEN